VVDDDATVAEVVAGYLTRAGLRPRVAADGPAAILAVERERPDLVVLDIMLPGLDGLEVCRRLRSRHPDIPVVMLSARGEEEDRVLGLQVGADDYLTKPFSPRELVLRVQSVLRRAAGDVVSDRPLEVLVDADLRIDPAARRATLGPADLSLTSRELDLLAFLVAHPDQAFTRVELLRSVWGWEFGDQSTVTVHVRRLREKIEVDASRPRRLSTVWGYGYRWDSSGTGDADVRPGPTAEEPG